MDGASLSPPLIKDVPIAKLVMASPFSSFAITTALDITTAAGTLYELMDGGEQVMVYISISLGAVERLNDH